MSTILSQIEVICPQCFCWKNEYSQRDNYFPFLASYRCAIPEGMEMSRIRPGTSSWRPCIPSMSTMTNFQGIWSEETRSIEDTLEVPKYFFALNHAGSSYDDEELLVYTSGRKNKTNDCPKDLSLSRKRLSGIWLQNIDATFQRGPSIRVLISFRIWIYLQKSQLF